MQETWRHEQECLFHHTPAEPSSCLDNRRLYNNTCSLRTRCSLTVWQWWSAVSEDFGLQWSSVLSSDVQTCSPLSAHPDHVVASQQEVQIPLLWEPADQLCQQGESSEVTETFGSNMSKSGRWLTQEGTKCLMCAVMQCCRAPGSQGCCSVSLRWDRISCRDQCYREVMFLWLYIEILVVDKRTYELLKEPLFDFWMINRSKPSSEPWRARGQHLTKSTDGGAVHTFHYF